MTKGKTLLAIAFLGLVLTGCGSAKLEDGKELVVGMKDMNITADDLYNALKHRYGINTLVNEMDRLVLNKEYKTTDTIKKQIDAQILAFKEQLGENFNSTILYYYGAKSESELYEFLEIDMKKKWAIDDYALSIVTEDEINKYYEEKAIGDIKAYHILIKPDTTSTMTEDEVKTKEKEALDEAKALIEELNKSDNKLEKFKELAKKNSDDGTASKGGELNYFNRGDMVKEFEEEAVKLGVNEYSKTPVKTSFGYHIIFKTEQKGKEALDKVKDSIKSTIAEEKVETSTNIEIYAMEKLREKYEVKVHDANLKEEYDNYVRNAKAQQ